MLSRTGSVLSHLNSLTHRSPQYLPMNLCSSVTLVFTLRLRCNRHSLFVKLLFFRIDNPSRHTFRIRPRTLLISFRFVLLRTLVAARSLASFFPIPLLQALERSPLYGVPWSPATTPSHERSRVKWPSLEFEANLRDEL